MNNELLYNYFRNLVNRFFKILPMREEEDATLVVYMQSLQSELIGCKELVESINNDPSYMTLLSVLQYLIDNPKEKQTVFRREVFRSISICNKLSATYVDSEV